MFRGFATLGCSPNRFPRIRGDVPALPNSTVVGFQFSPHTRGCSAAGVPVDFGEDVFPAYAGMFRPRPHSSRAPQRFPRIRGDVPTEGCRCLPQSRFSPHTRGCSAAGDPVPVRESVFPAYAGMFRNFFSDISDWDSFPRIRGDVPRVQSEPVFEWQFSPHTRGCSGRYVFGGFGHDVFPAYAGMFLHDSRNAAWYALFSPHTRGCSALGRSKGTIMLVFPAYAGMFLRAIVERAMPVRFPRIRGDVPQSNGGGAVCQAFSPHTRGCSEWATHLGSGLAVFPAYAGMFRCRLVARPGRCSFPRIRGDVPWFSLMRALPVVFSPHTRGCSARRWCQSIQFGVFPAYTGMFRTV